MSLEEEILVTRKIVDLDVREILRAKQEPFPVIMDGVNKLADGEVLQLHATFEPKPLLKVLGKQGYASTVQKVADDHYIVQFYTAASEGEKPYWHLDNRGLEPPQPMVRTLELLDGDALYADGEQGLEIWNERVPAILLPELDERGFVYDIDDEGNATVVIRIHK